MRLIVVLTAMLACSAAAAQPRVPCAGIAAVPPYPAMDERPAVSLWRDVAWVPPVCLGWPTGRAAVVVAFAARFQHEGPPESLVQRFGEVSKLTQVRYWSVTDKRWQPLFQQARALGEDGKLRRDLTLSELVPGREWRFEQKDNRLPVSTVQGLTVRLRDANRVQIDVRNVEPVELVFVDIAKPGAMRTAHLLEREALDRWRYYSVTQVESMPKLLGGGNDASWINRANALYRHIAGIRTDQEPPLAR
jgi:hypothetical protein